MAVGIDKALSFYRENYGGGLPEEVFSGSFATARSFVDDLVGFNDPESAMDAYLEAVCAVVETFAANGEPGVSSFHVGGVSVTNDGDAASKKALQAAMNALRRSGLLYQGVR